MKYITILLLTVMSSCTIVIKIPCEVKHEKKDMLAPAKPSSNPSGTGCIIFGGSVSVNSDSLMPIGGTTKYYATPNTIMVPDSNDIIRLQQ